MVRTLKKKEGHILKTGVKIEETIMKKKTIINAKEKLKRTF